MVYVRVEAADRRMHHLLRRTGAVPAWQDAKKQTDNQIRQSLHTDFLKSNYDGSVSLK